MTRTYTDNHYSVKIRVLPMPFTFSPFHPSVPELVEGSLFHIPGMMFEYFAPQHTGIDMRINLRCADALVAQQRLNHSQISAPFEQRCGKRVSQRVGRYRLLDASHLR